MTIQKYSIKEALNRIIRSLTGNDVPQDTPDTVTGEIYSEDKAVSLIAELLQGSYPGQTLSLPAFYADSLYAYGAITADADIRSGDDMIAADAIIASGTVKGSLVQSTSLVRQADTWHAYGGFQTGTSVITISTVDVWYHVTNATNDLWTGLEADGLDLTDDVLTVVNHGDYVGSLALTISGLPSKDFELRIYNITQGIQMGYHSGATTTGAGNYTTMMLPIYAECNAGDQLRVEIRNVTDNNDPTVRNAVFELHYLHD